METKRKNRTLSHSQAIDLFLWMKGNDDLSTMNAEKIAAMANEELPFAVSSASVRHIASERGIEIGWARGPVAPSESAKRIEELEARVARLESWVDQLPVEGELASAKYERELKARAAPTLRELYEDII